MIDKYLEENVEIDIMIKIYKKISVEKLKTLYVSVFFHLWRQDQYKLPNTGQC